MNATPLAPPPPARFNAAAHLLGINAAQPDKTAFIDDHGTLSYGELAERARRCAAGLLALGLRREQRVLMVMHDGIDFPVAFLGAIYAGIVPVPVNTLLTAADYAYMLQHADAQAVLVSAPLRAVLDEAVAASGLQPTLIVSGERSFAALLDHAPLAEPAATAADEFAFWLYSSGSTGRPKGTVHSHANLYWTAELYGKPMLGLRADDVLFSAAKLFFAYGLGNALTFPISVGATTVLMAERPTPAAVFKRWTERGVTVFFGAPTGFAGMLAAPDLPARAAVKLRMCSSAGEALPREIGERFQRHFGCEIVDGIGSTEMLHIYISNRPGDVHYGTSGSPVPGYRVKLVDEAGHGFDGAAKPGEIGDLYVAGPSSAHLYWANRDKTTSTFQGEWTKSGDKYFVDEHGHYVYAGRSDDMLKVSGIYVSPFEVESTLQRHPAVLEAAVIGKQDADGLTKTKAFVVLKPGAAATEDELKAFVKDQLAPYKYPRFIEFVAELPKTATGKIQRFRLRELEMAPSPQRGEGAVHLDWRGHELRLEVQWVGVETSALPVVVFLHEGLGSVAMWKDFPQRFCKANALRGLVFSRYGYGRSTPKPPGEHWQPGFMHAQAHDVLPALLAQLGIERPWLFGHSDGGSIALLHAARFPVAGIVVVAPHVFVEEVSVTSIAAAKLAYETTGLRERLAKYHDDVDSAFRGWNDVWLSPAFRSWNIEADIEAIACPVLAVQGEDDEYGTLEQIRAIARQLPQTQLCVLAHCGHSPHRDQPEALIREAGAFIQSSKNRSTETTE